MPLTYLRDGRPRNGVSFIIPPPGETMSTRNTVFAIAIAAAAVVFAPLYGPGIRARAATPAEDLDKEMKSVAAAFALVEKNFADPVSSEKAFYQGARSEEHTSELQ